MTPRKCVTLLLLAGFAPGCDPSNNAVVTHTDPPLLHYRQYTPYIHVETSDGKHTRVGKLGGPFYILVFAAPPGEDPCFIDPRVRHLADKLYLDSIPVIQITLPTDNCALTPEQRQACTPPGGELYRVFDPDRLAWEACHKPQPGSAILVNRQNLIPMVDVRKTLDETDDLLHRAEQYQREWERDQAGELGVQ